jgi:hypothetical protein
MQSFVGTDRNEMWFGASKSNGEGGEEEEEEDADEDETAAAGADADAATAADDPRASLMRAMGITASPDEATTSSGSGPE